MKLNTQEYAPVLLDNPEIISQISRSIDYPVFINGGGPSLFTIIDKNAEDTVRTINRDYPQYRLVMTGFRDLV